MVDRRDASELLGEMVRIARTFKQAGQRSRERSLSGTRFGVLQLLTQGDARLSTLAVQLGVSLPVASRTVDSLEQDGLAVRRPDPDDARAALIAITDSGRASVDERHSYIAGLFADAIHDWSDEEVRRAADTLARLRGHLDDVMRTAEARPPDMSPRDAASPNAPIPNETRTRSA